MKRRWIIAVVMLFVAALVYGATAITINPSEMKSGESKTLVDGRNTITVRRDGDDVNIKIEGAGATQSLTITRSGDKFRIERDGMGLIIPPKFLFDDAMPRLREKKMLKQTWFVCPKDKTMLRVPAGKEDRTYKCPVDGTSMERRKTHGFSFFFDDDEFGTESL
jgi:hypothetical protein